MSKIKQVFKGLLLAVLFFNTAFLQAQVEVDINLNIRHSVDGVSDFGRERHMTVHSTPTETDWAGEEDKLDYFINDLDVYFGRDNGAATWKFRDTPEDPNRPNKPDVSEMIKRANSLKKTYEGKNLAHQYEKGAMIMGTNPHPTYPTLDWGVNGRGKTWHDWQPLEVETSAEWVVEYLDNYFSKTPKGYGEPMPTYWEVINEPDMEMMIGGQGWIYVTSQEKLWEYHNLVAEGVKARIPNPDMRPKIGGMTWGQHDFYKQDGMANRAADDTYNKYASAEMLPYFEAMSVSTVNDTKKSTWYQWDVMWQGFIDNCGANMDFYGIHIYDWPKATRAESIIRTGGHVEAMLDMLEWYDYHKFGERKDIVLSEFGSVSGWLDDITPERRAWENLKPFNAMFMQFLERPSHVVLSMPFTPIKAEWGDVYDADGNLTKRYPSTLLDKADPTAKKGEDCEWVWTDFVKFYELWSEVDGTRIDTKSTDPDFQVDAYVDGKEMYLIINSLQVEAGIVKLNMFDDYNMAVEKIHMKYMCFDPTNSVDGGAAYEQKTFSTAPGSLSMAGESTVVLHYTFSSPLTINQTSEENRFMCDIMNTESTAIGGEKFRKAVSGRVAHTININNVVVPDTSGDKDAEVTLRLGGRFPDNAVAKELVTFNGYELEFTSDWRGESAGDGRNEWFGVMEIEVPADYVMESNEIIVQNNGNAVDYTTAILQIQQFSKKPKRYNDANSIALQGISLQATTSIMQGMMEEMAVAFTPNNALDKNITWTSDNESVATVDSFGVVTAVANTGVATITAVAQSGNFSAQTVVTALPYEATVVMGLSIVEGASVELGYYVTTPLHTVISPLLATEQTVVWSSVNESVATVDETTGKVTGHSIGKSTVITAQLIDANNANQLHEATITVTVGIAGEEYVAASNFPSVIEGCEEFTVTVAANVNGNRDVQLELIKGDNQVVGSGTTSLVDFGQVLVPVTISLQNGVPIMGTDYKLRATLSDGSVLLQQCEAAVTILDIIHVESVSIADGLDIVQVGKTLSLTSSLLPLDAYDSSISWESDDVAIATVNSNGTVTGVSAGQVTISVTSTEGAKSDEVKITVQDGEVTVLPEELVIEKTVSIFPKGTYTYTLEFKKTYTTERNVKWESSNTNIATVDANGVVTAGDELGSAEIKVSSVDAPSVFATSTVNVSNLIVVQAEDFTATGGAFDGFVISSIGINNNQSGDWADYQVYLPESGNYSLKYYVGAPSTSTDAGVNLYVGGVLKSKNKVPAGAGWDAYVALSVSEELALTAGQHTLRMESYGTSSWQWNCDRFELTKVTEATGLAERLQSSVSVYPNPANDKIFIEGLDKGNYTVAAYNLNGVLCFSSNIDDVNNACDVTDLPVGLYIMFVEGNGFSATVKFSKK